MEKLITILGPTATGKTALAANLASLIHGEIISADSRQIYRGMDIGTGKDIDDYTINEIQIPHHIIDIVEPGTRYNVFEYLVAFTDSFNKIVQNEKIPILCGGSGMYIDSVLRGYKMSNVPENKILRSQLSSLSEGELVNKLKTYGELHNRSDITDVERLVRAIEIADHQTNNKSGDIYIPKFNSINFGISFERSVLRKRITERLKIRLDEGMISEVKNLLDTGIKPDELIYYGLEYKFVTLYITGAISYESMFTQLNTAIHQFAKRQMTWYRRMEKKGVKIHWIDGSIDIVDKLAVILKYLNN